MNYEMIFATTNKGKLEEARAILAPHKIVVYGLNDLNIKNINPEENGKTYSENSLIKAEAVQKITTLPIFADDSGLEVLSLNNEPGIYSARYAEKMGGYDKAMSELMKRLEGKDRSARFVCDIVLVNVEDKPLLFEGIVNGTIAEKKEGENGFGYDPIFICQELNKTYALLTEKEKNTYSHRAKALKKMLTYLIINGLAK